jgi:hypothetical protein
MEVLNLGNYPVFFNPTSTVFARVLSDFNQSRPTLQSFQ